MPIHRRTCHFPGELRQITEPAILIFDLKKNVLIHRYVIDDEVLRDSTVLTSIVS